MHLLRSSNLRQKFCVKFRTLFNPESLRNLWSSPIISVYHGFSKWYEPRNDQIQRNLARSSDLLDYVALSQLTMKPINKSIINSILLHYPSPPFFIFFVSGLNLWICKKQKRFCRYYEFINRKRYKQDILSLPKMPIFSTKFGAIERLFHLTSWKIATVFSALNSNRLNHSFLKNWADII